MACRHAAALGCGAVYWTITALGMSLGFFRFAVAPVAAQEGHPLKGSGCSWKDNEALGDDLIPILDWDGKAITGMINPGTDNIPIADRCFEPPFCSRGDSA
jgi:hypothetical protein